MNRPSLSSRSFGKYVKYDTHIGRHLADYYEIRSLIVTLKEMLKYYVRKHEEFYKYIEENTDRNKDLSDLIIPLESVLVNIVTTYTRCFDTSKKQEGKESRRFVQLNKSFIKDVDLDLLEFHDLMFELRNKRVSHAGITPLEKYDFVAGMTAQGEFHIKPGEGNFRAFITDKIDLSKADLLMDKIIAKIDQKVEAVLENGYRELLLLNSNNYAFMIKLIEGSPITQDDVKRFKRR